MGRYKMSNHLSPEQMDSICDAVYAGRKIEAIKLYRNASGEGLKEAKQFVETLTERLRQENSERFTPALSGQGCAGVVLTVAVALSVILIGAWAVG